MRALAALAWADVLERVRRSSFLVVLALVLWLAIGVFTGDVVVLIGRGQGAMNAAWAAGMMTLVGNTVLTLGGFWFVRNAVERDERTGVGEILATTPLSRVTYTLGKAASHLAVLLAMLGILCAAGFVLLLARGAGVGSGAGGVFDAVAYFGPFVLIAVPALALTAACAVVFETTPVLRSAAGSVLWMIVWSSVLIASLGTRSAWFDPWGFTLLSTSLNDAARAHLAGHADGLNITIGGSATPDPSQTFPWSGVAWTPALVAARLMWLGVAAAIGAVAAVPFHRFDPARGRARAVAKAGEAASRAGGAAIARGVNSVTSLVAHLPGGRVGSELRLLVAGGRAGWWLVMLGLVVAGFFVPITVAKSIILPAAWIWPLTRFAGLGSREQRFATTGFLFPSARYVPRQVLAAWLAGTLFALVAAAGVLLRLAIALDGAGLAALVAGTLFVPALALALGTLSGTPRLFEVIYSMLWYAGPMRHIAPLDYAGVTPGAQPALWFALAAGGVAIALAARARQIRT